MEELIIYIRKIGNFLSGPVISILLLIATLFLFHNLYTVSSSYHEAKSKTSASADKQSEYEANNKVVKYLPYRDNYYSISYDRDGNNPVIIKIFAKFPLDRNDALQYLISKDPDVTINHKIEFPDFKSPLIKKGGV